MVDYLSDNPGTGMSPSVQTGYFPGAGFVIRSAPGPRYVRCNDECRIPFELRFRDRLNLKYDFYKVTDDLNHQTDTRVEPPRGNLSRLEVKRLRLIWEGTAFDPDLRFHLQLDTSTRGVPGLQANGVVQTEGAVAPNGAPTSPIGGGVRVDHAVRLYAAYVAYDVHPACIWEPRVTCHLAGVMSLWCR